MWLGYAWRGCWRIAALMPLFGIAVTATLVVVAALTIPESPPIVLSALLLAILVDGVGLFAPVGLIYLVVVGIIRRARTRPAKT
jgi:hypothetical protein